MANPDSPPDPFEVRRRALARWENEGGAPAGPARGAEPIPDLTNAELVQLRVRVIALESLLIGILADGSERQLQAARNMIDYIAPRPGFTPHPLTVQAANHIAGLVDRAVQFRTAEPATAASAD